MPASWSGKKHSLQQQARYCGEGRIGHGTKARVDAVYKAGDQIASFRDTINHRYSKALIEYAVKNGYGTIQMEELSAIQENLGFPRRLRYWTYYDLQTKIINKAKEHGIAVEKIAPQYTSQRCSKCGHIDSANRPRRNSAVLLAAMQAMPITMRSRIFPSKESKRLFKKKKVRSRSNHDMSERFALIMGRLPVLKSRKWS